jgi:hypothetical protein
MIRSSPHSHFPSPLWDLPLFGWRISGVDGQWEVQRQLMGGDSATWEGLRKGLWVLDKYELVSSGRIVIVDGGYLAGCRSFLSATRPSFRFLLGQHQKHATNHTPTPPPLHPAPSRGRWLLAAPDHADLPRNSTLNMNNFTQRAAIQVGVGVHQRGRSTLCLAKG